MKFKFFLLGLGITAGAGQSIYGCDFEQQLEMMERKIKESWEILDRKNLEDVGVVKDHLSIMCGLDQEGKRLQIACDNQKTLELVHQIDQFNTDYLKAILAVHGWITISKFGEKADRQAWLLVQHADHDPDFQEKWLSVLKGLIAFNETDKKNYAYLYDRVALKTQSFGLQQKYGTQAHRTNEGVELAPCEGSIDDLNRCRAYFGFEPIEDYMETLKRVFITEKAVL